MPFYERQAALDRSFAAYNRLYSDLDLEFSICDDGSPTPLVAHGCTVTTLPRKEFALTPTTPINASVNASTRDLILLTNPECEHRSAILVRMAESIVNWNDYVIAACIESSSGRWLVHSSIPASGEGRPREPVPEGSGFHHCVMFTRELWNKAGGFDEEYRAGQGCDDNDWLWRCFSVGAHFIMRDDLVVYHHRDGGARCKWPVGGLERNRKILRKKWSHLWKTQS